MFGDFLNKGKHGQLDFENIDDLEDGTPIVARYNNREFQFGIYGEGYVIYQDCWQTKAGVLVFSLEQSSIEEFSRIQQSMNIRPILNLIKKKRIIMQNVISRSWEIKLSPPQNNYVVCMGMISRSCVCSTASNVSMSHFYHLEWEGITTTDSS